MLRPTLVLDGIFDPGRGWNFPPSQVPIRRTADAAGIPIYLVSIDGIEVMLFEQLEWAAGTESNVSPTRIVLRSWVIGVDIANPLALSNASYNNSGMPSFT